MSNRTGDEIGYGELIKGLIKDGEGFAKARLNLYKALAKYRAAQARLPLAMIVAGVVVAFAAVIGLTLGIVLALALCVGPLLAGIIVGVVGAAGAIGLVMLGIRWMPDFTDLPFEEEDLIAPGPATAVGPSREELGAP